MANNATCVQCGGTDFYIESGFYFCSECQIQSQDMREEILLHEHQGGTQVRTTNVVSKKAMEQEIDKGAELTSWELLNFVLKGWVDQLMSLGVDAEVKKVTLQLWVTYLRKLEVAFTSSIVKKKPRLGFTFRTRDAELIYGVPDAEAKLLKQPFSCNSSVSGQVSSDRGVTSRNRTNKKRALASALYEEESVASETSHSNISLENLSTSSATSVKSKMCYTVHARKTLTKLIGSLDTLPKPEHKKKALKIARMSELTSLRHLKTVDIFSVLRLALLICRSPVQLSHLFRWSQEGYFSLRNIEGLLPASVNVTKDIKALLTGLISSWAVVTRKVHHLSRYLGMEHIGVDLLPIVEKLANELLLPDDIMDVVRRLHSMVRPKLPNTDRVNYEGRAIGFIIFVLKCVFSLDGHTETINSRTASIINKGLDKKGADEKRLFSWTKWTESLEFRDAVVSKYHVPNREMWYPGISSPDTITAFLGQWSMAPKRQTIHRSREVNRNIADTLERMLEPLCCDGLTPPPPSLDSSASLVRHAASLVPPAIQSKLNSLLELPSSYSIFIYFDYQRLNLLAEEHGCEMSRHLATGYRRVSKYSLDRASRYRDVISVSLRGQADLSDDERSESDVDEPESDVDEPECNFRLKRKKKVENSRSRKLMKCEVDSSDETDEISLIKENFSKKTGMTVLRSRNGNIASRIDLSEEFKDTLDETDKPVLHLNHDGYWKLHGLFSRNISIEEFNEFACASFSPAFYWLLNRCSKLVHQSMRDVYRELILVEEVYTRYVHSVPVDVRPHRSVWKRW